MARSRLRVDQIGPGIPLPFDTFDNDGNLLLRRGFVLESADQVERLVSRGLFADGIDEASADRGRSRGLVSGSAAPLEKLKGKKVSVFGLLDECQNNLEALIGDPDAQDFSNALLAIAAGVQRACKLDADAALAGTLLRTEGRYTIRRLVQASIVVDLLLTRMEQDEATRLIAVAAALTRDISMMELQDQLFVQPNPPDEAQTAELHSHPTRSVQMLRERGVTNETWLELVHQHHETIDGTGFPRALSGEQILQTAEIISLADRYGSMIWGRAYRPAMLPSAALREIFSLQGHAIEARLVALLVKEIGVYPPGSIVTLANGDTAVVLKRMPHAHQPVVRCVRNSSMQRLPGAPKRLTKEAVFAVKAAVPLSSLKFAIDPAQIWEETFEFDPG